MAEFSSINERSTYIIVLYVLCQEYNGERKRSLYARQAANGDASLYAITTTALRSGIAGCNQSYFSRPKTDNKAIQNDHKIRIKHPK